MLLCCHPYNTPVRYQREDRELTEKANKIMLLNLYCRGCWHSDQTLLFQGKLFRGKVEQRWRESVLETAGKF